MFFALDFNLLLLEAFRFIDDGGLLLQVTNTPWGERATFAFDPSSDLVAKPLHVSPFMVWLGNSHALLLLVALHLVLPYCRI